MVSESFLSRWSKRKIEGEIESNQEIEKELQSEVSDDDKNFTPINDDLFTLEDESDKREQPQSIASLLASQAAKETKKAALRKLFLSGEFSEVDRLNDYDHDYSSVKPLATEVAQQLREWLSDSTDQLDEENRYDSVIAKETLEPENDNLEDEFAQKESVQPKNETKNTT